MPTKTAKQPKKEAKTKQDSTVSEFAVIETGGKQYKVSPGESIKIEIIKGEHKEGEKITFDKVLLVDDGSNTTIGMPYIDGASVVGEISKIGRHPKVIVMKYKAKSNRLKKNGHKQPYFEVKIQSIQ